MSLICSASDNCSQTYSCAHALPHTKEDCANKGMGAWWGWGQCEPCKVCTLDDALILLTGELDPCAGCICRPEEELLNQEIEKESNEYMSVL